jgi:hypothetical protein
VAALELQQQHRREVHPQEMLGLTLHFPQLLLPAAGLEARHQRPPATAALAAALDYLALPALAILRR